MISGRGKYCGLVEPINDSAVPRPSSKPLERQTHESEETQTAALWLIKARLEDEALECSSDGLTTGEEQGARLMEHLLGGGSLSSLEHTCALLAEGHVWREMACKG